MNSKFTKTYILAGILIVAIIALLIPKYIKNGHENTEPQKIFSFEIKNINKIDLEYPDQQNRESGERQRTQLQKVDNRWVVTSNNNYKAQQKEVADLLEKAAEITQGELASSNPARQEALEIGSQKGAQVKLYQNENKIADFWLGKSSAAGNATYFRLAGSDLAYTTKTNIRFYFSRPEWIDKTIVKLDKEEINKITLSVDKKVIFEKEEIVAASTEESGEAEPTTETKWQVISPQKFEANENKLNNLLSALSNLNAQKVVFGKNSEDVGLDNTKKQVTFYLTDKEKPYELLIGDKIEAPEMTEEEEMMGGPRDAYYVKLADSDQIFTIGAYFVETLFSPELDELRVEEE